MLDAFLSKVAKTGPGDCWEWRGAKNAKGYGNFRSRSAHVVAYELAKGPIPVGLTIDHLCENRACVNPAHLDAVTHQENVRRHASKITHCVRGHPLSGDNILIRSRPDGIRRKCRMCARVHNRAARLRKKT